MSQKNLNKKLKLLFKSLKIKKGDKIIIHSNIAGLLQFYGNSKEAACKVFFSFLKKYLGKKGVIIIPTYNYQFTKNKKFNIETSPSEVGFFSNYLLKKYWKKRTFDPIFSHLIFGKIKKYNVKRVHLEAFGYDGIFASLLENNFKILCFCCSTERITFIHFIEYIFKVPYRYVKKFKNFLEYKKIKKKIVYKYFVGKKKYDYSIKEKKINNLRDNINFIKRDFGRFECYSVSCDYLFKSIGKKIKKDKNFLIK